MISLHCTNDIIMHKSSVIELMCSTHMGGGEGMCKSLDQPHHRNCGAVCTQNVLLKLRDTESVCSLIYVCPSVQELVRDMQQK